MSVRMVVVHYYQNNNYEISMNGYQASKINEIRDLIFGFQRWETFLSIEAEIVMFTEG